ncbi:DUF4982 domain-containing protein [Mucilaginibacter terrae]|uniref:DUF4982 domain-containing protein n=1 Tax=Mucilaginibacter terrae TaxID=1955052 RepID=UPI00362FC91A
MGEEKEIIVYSKCKQAELLVNGKSYGIKKRNSQDFPAAGLRWKVVLNESNNTIKVVAKKEKSFITTEITQAYQTQKWGKTAEVILEQTEEKNWFDYRTSQTGR